MNDKAIESRKYLCPSRALTSESSLPRVSLRFILGCWVLRTLSTGGRFSFRYFNRDPLTISPSFNYKAQAWNGEVLAAQGEAKRNPGLTVFHFYS